MSENTAQEISKTLKAARTAWLESFGVPVSVEFGRFAEAIGAATDYLDAAPTPPPRWLEVAHRPYGWDERDYKLAAALRQLPSYGLIANGDWMISVKEAIALIEAQAKERGDARVRKMENLP